MKLASFQFHDNASYGVVEGDTIIDIGSTLRSRYPTLAALLGKADFLAICEQVEAGSAAIPIAQVTLLQPIPVPGKIICVGLNYEDHRIETRHAKAAYPTLFTRFPDSQCAHGQAIRLPDQSNQLDFEAELAVVIGQPCNNVSVEDAMRHVAGYACYNDGSIRDWQTHTSQFLPGKNFASTGAFGPYLVTADEVTNPQDLSIVCRLNGSVVQSARTSMMIHSIAEQISYISRFTALSPGDVIATGTPGGVGFTRNPPLFMQDGDTVEVEIEHVGTLRNPVARAARHT